jgi:soluble lytic murein transglycosylase-like protein
MDEIVDKVTWLSAKSGPLVADAADGGAAQSRKKLHDTAENFEALMAGFLVRSMRQAMSSSGFYGSAYGSEIFQSMMDEVLAQTLAARANLGIAEALERQLASRVPASAAPPVKTAGLENYEPIITAAAARHGVDANLLRAMIQQESAGDASAVSSKGAAGLMQLMLETAAMLGVHDRFDPEENISGGAEYFAGLIQRFGTVEKALAAYNAGPTAVEKYGGIPDFPETQDYVTNVMKKYRALLSQPQDAPAEKAGGPW